MSRHVIAGNPAQPVREDRAFYSVTSDPHLFPTDIFFGRLPELRALRDAIDTAPSRLVTVVGPAGVGKTRLALEAVRTADDRDSGGVAIVRLAAIERPDGIVPEIARALGMIDQAEKLDDLVRETLAKEPVVLVLDCFEHLTPAANDLISGLLRDCPPLHIVLTSRRPTGLPGEHLLELQPLNVAVGQTLNETLRSDAVRLFIDRARRARPWFTLQDGDAEIIAQLCARYDGLPLAIELMASWMTVLTPRDLLAWQPERLEFRTPVEDPRHQSLLDAIAWSIGLLSPAAQSLFARLSVFTGGFSRDLVEHIAQGREAGAGYPYADGYGVPWPFHAQGEGTPVVQPQDPAIAQAVEPLGADPVRALATLIDHHLVYQSGEIDGVPRFDMLESIREFGQRRLKDTGRLEPMLHAHAATMVAFCEAAGEGFWHKEYRFWARERIDADLQNIRAAIAWSERQGHAGAELTARLAGPLWNYWQTCGLITEGRRYLDRALFLPSAKQWIVSKESPGLAFLCWIQGDDDRCEQVIRLGMDATAGTGGFSSRGMLYLVMALLEFRKGLQNAFTMMEYAEEAERLFATTNDRNGQGACYLIFGQACRLTGDTAQALELFETARAMHLESGYEWGVAAGCYFAAEATRDLAETDPAQLPKATALLHEALERFWAMGDFWGAGGAMSGLACILALRGKEVKAATWFGAAHVLMGRVGGSLLPSELMTHHETEADLQARMPAAVWREAFGLGTRAPDLVVGQALTDTAPSGQGPGAGAAVPRLTRTQLSIVQDLVQGYDIPRIAQRRGRSLSATYELVDRILEKMGLSDRDAIAPYAIKLGLVGAPSSRPGFIPPK